MIFNTPDFSKYEFNPTLTEVSDEISTYTLERIDRTRNGFNFILACYGCVSYYKYEFYTDTKLDLQDTNEAICHYFTRLGIPRESGLDALIGHKFKVTFLRSYYGSDYDAYLTEIVPETKVDKV